MSPLDGAGCNQCVATLAPHVGFSFAALAPAGWHARICGALETHLGVAQHQLEFGRMRRASAGRS